MERLDKMEMRNWLVELGASLLIDPVSSRSSRSPRKYHMRRYKTPNLSKELLQKMPKSVAEHFADQERVMKRLDKMEKDADMLRQLERRDCLDFTKRAPQPRAKPISKRKVSAKD